MRIFIFKSDANPELRAFGGDLLGSQLPNSSAPGMRWGLTPDQDPPHNLSRDMIETAIKDRGFQLWRMSKKDQSSSETQQAESARRPAEGGSQMTGRTHKFKVGQTVDLIPSMSRSAARGYYEIISLRPGEEDNPQYRVKSRSDLTTCRFGERSYSFGALKFDWLKRRRGPADAG